MKIAMVHWRDASYISEAANPKEYGPIRCTSVGILVVDDPEFVTVALEGFEDGDYRRQLSIPRENIAVNTNLIPPLFKYIIVVSPI